jgi:hypothetical protein
MRSEDLKRELETAARQVLDILNRDGLDELSVDEEWSDIPDVKDHLTFLGEQIAGLAASIRNVRQ